MRCCILLIALALLFRTAPLNGQSEPGRLLVPADSLHAGRLAFVAGAWTTLYGLTLYGLNEYWYAEYERGAFHFFNDGAEWLQMDKAGHVYTAYFESRWTMRALQWSGLQPAAAAWAGALTGFLFQTSIEWMDGYSAAWGASLWDVAANAAGSAVMLSQELMWKQQRLCLKMSAWPGRYPASLQHRSNLLFGQLPERLLKDYNHQTYWLSVNPASFCSRSPQWLPPWLNIAVGYGADGMMGGYANLWEEEGEQMDYSFLPRQRQYYLSLDADLTRLPVKSPLLKTVFEIVNVIKIPAPALLLQPGQGLAVDWLAF
ncbi:MAG: DUF2279 domain-containing protein [Chitinophagales bacterium]|nr:DUF2279 domain-containing protein [Chitinophagales bacterium]